MENMESLQVPNAAAEPYLTWVSSGRNPVSPAYWTSTLNVSYGYDVSIIEVSLVKEAEKTPSDWLRGDERRFFQQRCGFNGVLCSGSVISVVSAQQPQSFDRFAFLVRRLCFTNTFLGLGFMAEGVEIASHGLAFCEAEEVAMWLRFLCFGRSWGVCEGGVCGGRECGSRSLGERSFGGFNWRSVVEFH